MIMDNNWHHMMVNVLIVKVVVVNVVVMTYATTITIVLRFKIVLHKHGFKSQ